MPHIRERGALRLSSLLRKANLHSLRAETAWLKKAPMTAPVASEPVQSTIDHAVPMLCQCWRNAELVIQQGKRQLSAQAPMLEMRSTNRLLVRQIAVSRSRRIVGTKGATPRVEQQPSPPLPVLLRCLETLTVAPQKRVNIPVGRSPRPLSCQTIYTPICPFWVLR